MNSTDMSTWHEEGTVHIHCEDRHNAFVWILTPGSEDLDCEGFLFVSFEAGEGGWKMQVLR